MNSPNYVSIVGFREYFVLLTAENKVPMPSPFIKYIQNEQHYTDVISRGGHGEAVVMDWNR